MCGIWRRKNSKNGTGIKKKDLESWSPKYSCKYGKISGDSLQPKGQILMWDDLVIFESIQKRKGRGKLIEGHENFYPTLIKEFPDNRELLVVEINIKEKSIRVMNGHGHQKKTGRGETTRNLYCSRNIRRKSTVRKVGANWDAC